MIEVFKTNVESAADAAEVLIALEQIFPAYTINFDLEDCDKILRIKFDGGSLDINGVIKIVIEAGFTASLLTENIERNKGIAGLNDKLHYTSSASFDNVNNR